MSSRLRKPSPAFVLALLALFVALGGSAVAAGIVPHAKLADKALVANNSLKLGGKTSGQIVASVKVPAPTPPTSVGSLTSARTATWTLAAGAEQNITANCDSGQKAVGGGFNNPTQALVVSAGSGPTSDGSGWAEDLLNLSSTTAANGTVVVTCIK